MTNKDDSKPFVVLRESAGDFQISFDADIKTCLSLLDSKISSLICNPDHSESPSRDGTRLNAHLEFSKAKLDIFLKVKSLVKEMQENWTAQINNMVSNFLENVEILLAKTNLETSFQSGSKKSSAQSQNRKSSVQASPSLTSSIKSYSLLSTAKRIPVLNSFLPRDDDDDEEEEEEEMEVEDTEMHISKNSSLNTNMKEDVKTYRFVNASYDKTCTEHSFRRGFEEINEDVQDDETSEEDNELQVPVTASKTNTIPVRRSAVRAVKEVAVKPSTSQRKTNEVISERPASRRSAVTRNAVSQEPVKSTPQKKNAAKGRKSILKVDPANDIELHATPSRSTRKRTAIKETSHTGNNNNDDEMIESSENDYEIAAPKTPKNVHFSVGFDVNEDLEIYSPEVKLTRSAPRRKTVMIPEIPEISSDFNLTPNVSRSKRKTIGSSAMDVSVAPSPKRFKRGSRASAKPVISEEPEEDSDHLESDESTTAEHYTPWLPLDDIDGKIPTQPGIYELKVYKAKKSAYIGSCDNLRNKLTLHKLGQNSGHKHLDKFLDRNKKDIQVRYEKIATAAQAKNEEMNRIKAFVAQHKTTPAYN